MVCLAFVFFIASAIIMAFSEFIWDNPIITIICIVIIVICEFLIQKGYEELKEKFNDLEFRISILEEKLDDRNE